MANDYDKFLPWRQVESLEIPKHELCLGVCYVATVNIHLVDSTHSPICFRIKSL